MLHLARLHFQLPSNKVLGVVVAAEESRLWRPRPIRGWKRQREEKSELSLSVSLTLTSLSVPHIVRLAFKTFLAKFCEETRERELEGEKLDVLRGDNDLLLFRSSLLLLFGCSENPIANEIWNMRRRSTGSYISLFWNLFPLRVLWQLQITRTIQMNVCRRSPSKNSQIRLSIGQTFQG